MNGKTTYRFKNEFLKKSLYIVVDVEELSDLNIK